MHMNNAAYKKYMLGLLVFITAFNSVDRLALGLVAQNIKTDLSLSDAELALLSGIAFALFYSIVGIPIARWADRGNRVTIIAATTALWSVAVALCGTARNFLQLAINRVVVSVGEAGLTPTTNSLIPDYFGRAERPRAMAIYALSSPLALVLGYGLAGWINQFYGWRVTFLVMSLPGIPLAILAALTLREPRTGPASVSAGISPHQPGTQNFWSVCLTLWRITSFRHLMIAYVVVLFFNNGIYQWVPSFFIRSYGMQTGELGTWLAVTNGVAGFVGTYLGGELFTRYAANNEPLQAKAMAVVFGISACLLTAVFLMPGYYQAFAFMALFIVLGMAVNGPMLAIKQTVVPERLRATSFAIVFMLGNLIGMGIGPLTGGMLSDALHPWLGEESLRYALVALTPGYLWASWHIWTASRTVLGDAAKAELENAPASLEQQAAVTSSAQ